MKAVHHVNGTVNGCRVRVTLEPGDSGWAFTMNPARMQHAGIVVGSQVPVELSPEEPQRGDLAEDVAAALEASPAAGAFFGTLAQFYRNGYLRYIDATKRRPDLRAARIAEVTSLLASGIKERGSKTGHTPLTCWFACGYACRKPMPPGQMYFVSPSARCRVWYLGRQAAPTPIEAAPNDQFWRPSADTAQHSGVRH